MIALDHNTEGSYGDTVGDDGSYIDTSSDDSLYFSSYISDYLILNLAVFFVYVDVIYKNAIFSPYLFFYYWYAYIGINVDLE